VYCKLVFLRRLNSFLKALDFADDVQLQADFMMHPRVSEAKLTNS
jgi:hypothetical protein